MKKLNDYKSVNLEQNRLKALYSVSQALGTSLDLDIVLTQVMDAVIFLTGAERGFLMLMESGPTKTIPATNELPDSLQLKAARNFEGDNLARKDMEVSRTVIRTVFSSGESVITTNAQSDPRFAEQDSVVYYNLRAILCAPLRSRGNTIGVIYVDNRVQTGVFSAEDLNLLDAFATQAAIAIENARHYMRTDQALAARISELETLSRIDEELNAGLDYANVVDLTLHWAIKGTQAERGWVAMFEQDQESLRIVSVSDPAPHLEVDNQSLKTALVDGFEPTLEPQEGKAAHLVVPLIRAGKPAGIILVERGESFSHDDWRFLKHLAGRAANAIENARLYQAVQDANQAKTKFVSIVTHELRIPMTSIKGYTDLMRQGAVGPVNEMQANFLNVIRNNVERMSTLVSDLSDISRIEAGRLKLDLQWFSLAESANEAVQNLRQRLEERNQTVQVDIPIDLPQVFADPTRVFQILNNLLSNAWKYTPEGGKIALFVCPQGGAVRVEIKDTGIGISPEDQASLFSQFFRSEDMAVREQQGWGLGLSITKSLVETMGGEIGFHSILKEGSTFWFTLPTNKW